MSEINIRGRATVRNDTGRLPDEGDIPVGEVALPPLEEEEEKRSFVRSASAKTSWSLFKADWWHGEFELFLVRISMSLYQS